MEKMETLGKREDASNIITTDTGLSELCETVDESMVCIKGFIKKCGTPIHRELFDFVLEQFSESVKLFCKSGETRSTFLKHSPCINNKILTQKNYHKTCVSDIFAAIDKGVGLFNKTRDDPNLFDIEKSSARTLSDSILDLTCCSYNRFESCSQALIVKECSQEAVDAMINFTEKTFGGTMTLVCPRSMFNPKDEMCTKVMPPMGAEAKGRLSDNPLGKYMLTYMNFLFNFEEPAAAGA